jgi:type I restriction enzyme M protein
VAIVDPGKDDTILDPACGTAGFLISAFKHIKKKNNNELTPDERKKLIRNFVGYDISPDMVRLSLVNLYLHGFSDPHIHEYDTLSSEDRWNESFDVILANPPFMSPKGGIRPHKKFTIDSNRSEVLFVDYIAEHLNPKGKAGIIVPEGVIYQSGRAYRELRKMLIHDSLYAVISLPAGVFNPYSGVKTSIILLDKERAKNNEKILFVKLDNDGFSLGAQRTAIEGSQIKKATNAIRNYLIEGEIESDLAFTIAKEKVLANNECNLSGEIYKIKNVVNTKYPLKKLSQICSVQAGGTPSRKEPSYWGGDIPWVGSSVCKNSYVTASEEFITEDGLNNSSTKLFKKGTSLIALVGATIGKTGYLTFDSCTNQNVAGLYPLDEKSLNKKFLFLALKNLYSHFMSLGEGKFRMANLTFVRNLEIPVPPIDIQNEIVERVENYQSEISQLKHDIKLKEENILSTVNTAWETV